MIPLYTDIPRYLTEFRQVGTWNKDLRQVGTQIHLGNEYLMPNPAL